MLLAQHRLLLYISFGRTQLGRNGLEKSVFDCHSWGGGQVNHNGVEQREVRSKPQGYSEVKASLIEEELHNATSHPKRACVKQGSSPERQNRSEGGSWPGLAACMLGSPGEPESSRAVLASVREAST